jgi:hypothetical protein
MPASVLTPEARRENAMALAAALGIAVDAATQALDFDIAITVDATDATAQQIAAELAYLLRRTVRHVFTAELAAPISVEVIIGAMAARTTGKRLYLSVGKTEAVIRRTDAPREACESLHPLFGLIVACYCAAATLDYALDDLFGMPDLFVFRFNELGIESASLIQPVDLGTAYLAGAGAIGNGFLWAARNLDFGGELNIVDDDVVSSGNLNRQMWFEVADIDVPKAERLADKAQPFFPRLALRPRVCRLQDLPEKSDGAWLRRLIVAVDSRRARRQLQNEFPGEVFDASTTDVREVVLHHHAQPTNDACLSCIYAPDEEESSREHHIAEHLDVGVDEVRSERISSAVASIIVARFPDLDAAAITGMAYDSLFKQLCGESKLQTLAGRTVVAPFAFVSVLAGALLALDVVRRLGAHAAAPAHFNYWRLSPWHPPFARRRILRKRQSQCAFCGNAVFRRLNAGLWG